MLNYYYLFFYNSSHIFLYLVFRISKIKTYLHDSPLVFTIILLLLCPTGSKFVLPKFNTKVWIVDCNEELSIIVLRIDSQNNNLLVIDGVKLKIIVFENTLSMVEIVPVGWY